ncbi:hypothetical protein Tco_0961154 [Tanacetum coccineum]
MLGCQIYDENDDDENVPLNYYITNDLSIQFGREEFCLVTGLRFGVENWEEYDNQKNLPFRRRVFPSHLDGQPITGLLATCLLGAENRRNVPEWLLRIANDRVLGTNILGVHMCGQHCTPNLGMQTSDVGRNSMSKRLQMKMMRKRIHCVDILGIKGNIPAARLTPDDNEARSDWWISKIYRQFVEQKVELDRNKKDVDDIKEEMKKFREEMNARPVRQENTIPIVVGQHYGFSDFSEFRSMQNIPNRGRRQQVPSKYLVTPFTVQAPTTMVPKQRVSKTTNKGNKANLSPLNLGVFLRVTMKKRITCEDTRDCGYD